MMVTGDVLQNLTSKGLLSIWPPRVRILNFFLAMMGWGTLIRINSTVNHLVLLLLFNCVGQNLLPSVEQTARPRGVMTNYYLF